MQGEPSTNYTFKSHGEVMQMSMFLLHNVALFLGGFLSGDKWLAGAQHFSRKGSGVTETSNPLLTSTSTAYKLMATHMDNQVIFYLVLFGRATNSSRATGAMYPSSGGSLPHPVTVRWYPASHLSVWKFYILL